MRYYVGLDDTDNHTSRGTGQLARRIAAELAADFLLLGVTRHQLFVDPRVPYTSHNSSACLLLETREDTHPAGEGSLMERLFERARAMMLADFQTGSDPGLCVAAEVPYEISQFGRSAKCKLVSQEQARRLAAGHGLLLEGLGGSQDGIIGALAAVGLAASGDDGRYIWVGDSRELAGLQPVEIVRKAGIPRLCTLDGEPVITGMVWADKLRPARRSGQPVQYLAWQDGCWQPLKLD